MILLSRKILDTRFGKVFLAQETKSTQNARVASKIMEKAELIADNVTQQFKMEVEIQSCLE
jgi:serine/threonine protein kinase